jgi:mRNA (guanine-N7-)-methyltransferase
MFSKSINDKFKIHYEIPHKPILINSQDNEGLRKFHNWIKLQLLLKWSKCLSNEQNIKLCDIACGMGGDMFKWKQAGIKYVYGIDKNMNSIKEAIKRKCKSELKSEKYIFNVLDVNDPNCINIFENVIKQNIYQKFELITCHFAIHYFFRNEFTVSNFFNFVNHILKPGGLFIFTYIDANNLCKIELDPSSNLLELYNLENVHNINKDLLLGKEYTFNLSNTVYFDSYGKSKEYIVTDYTVQFYTEKHGLKLKEYLPFETWMHIHESLSTGKYFNMSNDEINISKLYKSVILTK